MNNNDKRKKQEENKKDKKIKKEVGDEVNSSEQLVGITIIIIYIPIYFYI